MPKLTVITPVGPGHANVANEARASVTEAARFSDYFTQVDHLLIDDSRGELGRSCARNQGILQTDAEWIFLLDADDLMLRDALCWFEPPKDDSCVAIFGSIYIQVLADKAFEGSYKQGDNYVMNALIAQHPLTRGWEDLINSDVIGTISMGAFFRRDALLDNLFLESLNAGEDFEFYLNLFSKFNFRKQSSPLVLARTKVPSAVGPRGYEQLDWKKACLPFVEFWRHRGRHPLSFSERLKNFGATDV